MKSQFLCFFLIGLLLSCTEYTPKPRGYVRIEPARAPYIPLSVDSLPYIFAVSCAASVELPAEGEKGGWIRIVYPSLGAKIYGSYLSVTPATWSEAAVESRLLVERQARAANKVREKAYSHPEADVYGSLFLIEGEVASPVQFLLTDSSSHFFRGALYYDCRPNADSLAPVTRYLEEDIVEMIQTFSWKKAWHSY